VKSWDGADVKLKLKIKLVDVIIFMKEKFKLNFLKLYFSIRICNKISNKINFFFLIKRKKIKKLNKNGNLIIGLKILL